MSLQFNQEPVLKVRPEMLALLEDNYLIQIYSMLNTQSNNERIILTFRNDDVEGNFYYEDARRKLFEEL